MSFPADQVEEVRSVYGNAKPFTEGADLLLLVTGVVLPLEREPCDIILVPKQFESYPSRLYFSRKLSSTSARNWNGSRSFLERMWYAFSWGPVDPSRARLLTLIQQHVRGLTCP